MDSLQRRGALGTLQRCGAMFQQFDWQFVQRK